STTLFRSVLRDLAADTDARVYVDIEKHGVGDGAADVIEVHVHAARTQLLEFGAVVGGGLVIEGGVEAQLVHQVAHFGVRSGDPYHAAAQDFCDLADDGTHRAGCARDHHSFAGVGMADIDQSEIGGETDVAQHAE